MGGKTIRYFSDAVAAGDVHYVAGVPYDSAGALLVDSNVAAQNANATFAALTATGGLTVQSSNGLLSDGYGIRWGDASVGVYGNGANETISAYAASIEQLQISSASGLAVQHTVTAAGTTGNQTINKPAGTVNIAAAGTTVTVTNSLVTANSHVFTTIGTNDATARIANVVPAAGSFVVNLTAAATAEVRIDFFVVNGI